MGKVAAAGLGHRHDDRLRGHPGSSAFTVAPLRVYIGGTIETFSPYFENVMVMPLVSTRPRRPAEST